MLPPLEYLTLFLNTKIRILLKTGDIYSGILQGIDSHINILLSEYEESKEDTVLFIRGENICLIGNEA
ncbi:Sm-like protein [Vairimorpha necatrix]|uniref:Sm-like protein n=1 Tax=Vairimorpha necatrix TaxID=6039 RepID=A0AAX4JGW7_9MICR